MTNRTGIRGLENSGAGFAINWRVFVRGFACLNLLVTGFVIVGILVLMAGVLIIFGIYKLNAAEEILGFSIGAICFSLYKMFFYLGRGIVDGMIGRTLAVLVLTAFLVLHFSDFSFLKALSRLPVGQSHSAPVTPAKAMIGQLSWGTDLMLAVAATLALLRRKSSTT